MNTSLREDEARNRQILERIPAGRWANRATLRARSSFLQAKRRITLAAKRLPLMVDGWHDDRWAVLLSFFFLTLHLRGTENRSRSPFAHLH